MDAITLRNFPLNLKKIVEQKAKSEKSSLNKTILKILESALLLTKKKKEYTDLDSLCGVLTESDYKELSHNIKKQRHIDPKLWAKS